MNEIRTKLMQYLDQRVTVRGCLSNFGDFTQNHREVGRACIDSPEVDSEVVANHVWVVGVLPHWAPHKGDIGKQVRFDAIVTEYGDKDGTQNYGLMYPSEPEILFHPPALKIPDLPDPSPPARKVPEPPVVKPLPSPEEKPVSDKPTDDSFEAARQAKAFIKALGGPDQAAKLVKALETVKMPMPQLIGWVKVLSE